MPTNSSIFGLLLCGIWLFFFYGANLTNPWFGFFCFDSSELPIVTIYAMYIPIFFMMIKREKDLSFFNRFVAPTVALAGCVFMIVAACFSHKMAVVAYLVIFAVIMGIGAMFANKKVESNKSLETMM
jgi:basic amino acid/polyamine antiporter, APA family